MDYGSRIEKVLARLPGPQRSAIDSFGNEVSVGMILALDPFAVNSYLDLTDQALTNLVWKGLEQSNVAYHYKDTASDRLAISKLAGPVIKQWVKTTPGLEQQRIEQIAVGLVGVHAAIWLPENAMQGAAKQLFVKAKDTLTNKVFKPYQKEHLAGDS